MQPHFPQAAVFTSQLPGHLSPSLRETSFSAFTEAYGHVIQTVFGGRPVVVCGESFGGTVALGLPNPGIACIALDPLLHTGGLSVGYYAAALEERPNLATFLQNLLGFDGEKLEPIDYRAQVRRPARVIVGEYLVPQGPIMASVVDESERQWLRDAPNIRFTQLSGAGHVMVWYEDVMVSLVSEALDRAIVQYNASWPVIA